MTDEYIAFRKFANEAYPEELGMDEEFPFTATDFDVTCADALPVRWGSNEMTTPYWEHIEYDPCLSSFTISTLNDVLGQSQTKWWNFTTYIMLSDRWGRVIYEIDRHGGKAKRFAFEIL